MFTSLTERDSASTDCWKDSLSVEVHVLYMYPTTSGRKGLIHSCIIF